VLSRIVVANKKNEATDIPNSRVIIQFHLKV
jgi:hypothetical protein